MVSSSSSGAALRAGRGIGARVAHAIDLDADGHELAGPVAPPGRVGGQAQRHAALGLAVDGEHVRAGLAHGQRRVDELEVAVDAVRPEEQVDHRRGEQTTGCGQGWHDGFPKLSGQTFTESLMMVPSPSIGKLGICEGLHTMSQNTRTPKSETPRRTQAERRRHTRQALLDAALLRMDAGDSFDSLSLRSVTRAAGVVPTAFYRHFDGMDELGLALVEESFLSLRGMLREAREQLPPADIIRRSVQILLEHSRAHRQHFVFVSRGPVGRKSGRAPRHPQRDPPVHQRTGHRPGALSRSCASGPPRTCSCSPDCSSTR